MVEPYQFEAFDIVKFNTKSKSNANRFQPIEIRFICLHICILWQICKHKMNHSQLVLIWYLIYQKMLV